MISRKTFIQLALTGLLVAFATPSNAFEAGQRWSCVTDQGADGFLAVINVQDDAVTFSWGTIDRESDTLTSLCEQRDALSLEEMKAFCRLLGDDVSVGHVRLDKACLQK